MKNGVETARNTVGAQTLQPRASSEQLVPCQRILGFTIVLCPVEVCDDGFAMTPIIQRTAARGTKRFTNTSIRLSHPTIVTTRPRSIALNAVLTIWSALRLGSFPRKPWF